MCTMYKKNAIILKVTCKVCRDDQIFYLRLQSTSSITYLGLPASERWK